MNKKPLSYSAINRYQICGRNYHYHYILKLREKYAKSFLILGSAIDAALNAVLLDFKENKKVTVDYKSIFDTAFSQVEINSVKYNTSDCTLITYSKNDFVEELLIQDDMDFIGAKTEELGVITVSETISGLKSEIESRRDGQQIDQVYTVADCKLLNTINYLSLRRKCHMMLQAYVEQFVPQLEDVLYVQHQVDLKSDQGHGFIGFVDAVVKFKGDDFYTVLDNKTSSGGYKADKLSTDAQQLWIYTYCLGLKHAGYAVMNKSIKLTKVKTCNECGEISTGRETSCKSTTWPGSDYKRCSGEFSVVVKPEASIQVLRGEIPEQIQESTIDQVGEVQFQIESGEFPQNTESCRNIFGSPCPYQAMCLYGQESSPYLVDMSKKE